jgi:hypothetical protein
MKPASVIITVIVVAVVLLILGWLLYAYWPIGASQYGAVQNQTAGSQQNSSQGTVYLSVTDAAADMGSVSEVAMTIDKAYVHSQSRGWVAVLQDPQTFKLLSLNASGQAQLLAQAQVPADTYDQIWLHMSKVTVTDSGSAKTAVLPSGDIKVNTAMHVSSGQASEAAVDVMANQSLHKTSQGEFVFAPVLTVESRNNADVSVGQDSAVSVSGGTVESNISAGMDVSGEVKNDFKLPSDAVLNVGADGGVMIK